MLFLSILDIIKCEVSTGFVREGRKQLLCIKSDVEFKDIKRSFLQKKQKNKEEFLTSELISEKTRYIQNEDEFKEHRERLRKLKIKREQDEKEARETGKYKKEEEDSDEDKEDERVYDEIFVDINHLERKSGEVYGILLELYKKDDSEFQIYSRAFTFSENENQWILSENPEPQSNGKYWTYGGIGIACILTLGFCVYFFS